jgi:hypothetical protein
MPAKKRCAAPAAKPKKRGAPSSSPDAGPDDPAGAPGEPDPDDPEPDDHLKVVSRIRS